MSVKPSTKKSTRGGSAGGIEDEFGRFEGDMEATSMLWFKNGGSRRGRLHEGAAHFHLHSHLEAVGVFSHRYVQPVLTAKDGGRR